MKKIKLIDFLEFVNFREYSEYMTDNMREYYCSYLLSLYGWYGYK